MSGLDRVDVLGVLVDPILVRELNERVLKLAREGGSNVGPSLVLNVNAHGLNLAWRGGDFARILRMADVVFADGVGVLLAAKMAGDRLPQRITYADWAWDLARLAADEGLSVYLLGGRPGVAERAGRELIGRHPDLKIAGTHHGYFDRTKSGVENRRVVEGIHASKPDLLLVGMGMPVQEEWLLENRRDLAGVRVAFNCGAALDYVSGELHRGPKLLTDNGFEWLARLVIDPKRLWWRYVVGNSIFLIHAAIVALERRIGGKKTRP